MIWFGLEYSSLTSVWRCQMGRIHSVIVSRDTEVTPCDYMSPWRWLASLICDIVSSLGHTIAREPLCHEETWNSPCGKDGWLTHIYRTKGKLSRKGPLSVYPSKKWDKTYSSQTLYTCLHGATRKAYTVCWLVRPMAYNDGRPGYIWTQMDSYFPTMDKVWIDQKTGQFHLLIKHFKVYISTKHLWMSVRCELKAVIRVLLTCCQYLELIMEAVSDDLGDMKRG